MNYVITSSRRAWDCAPQCRAMVCTWTASWLCVHVCDVVVVCVGRLCCCDRGEVCGCESGIVRVLARSVCPSGLRGYVQVVMFSNAWVQIPQLTDGFAPRRTSTRTLLLALVAAFGSRLVSKGCMLVNAQNTKRLTRYDGNSPLLNQSTHHAIRSIT